MAKDMFIRMRGVPPTPDQALHEANRYIAMVRQNQPGRDSTDNQIRQEYFDLAADMLKHDSVYGSKDDMFRCYARKTDGLLHLSIKRTDRRPMMERSVLLAAAKQMSQPPAVMAELFPSASRLVDTSNQYHAFQLPSKLSRIARKVFPLRHELPAVAGRPGHRAAVLNASDPVEQQLVGWFIEGSPDQRDWRIVQGMKDQMYGVNREAIDLLMWDPRGAFLLVAPEGMFFPVGFTSRLVADFDPTAQITQQRAFSEKAAPSHRHEAVP